MKYIIATVSVLIITLVIIFCPTNSSSNSDILRIHIRANSNLEIDQEVKYKVKDAVVDALIPILSQCTSKEEAERKTEENFEYIESVANDVLKNQGFSYTAHAKLSCEEFPTRVYGDVTYENGFYDALILELGKAEGDNWWCVVYPPLCFVNGSSKVSGFKSRILEIINNYFGN